MKDFNKRFGEFTNRLGEVVEYMLAPNMREKFKELGFYFNQANRDSIFEDDVHDIFFEHPAKLLTSPPRMAAQKNGKSTRNKIAAENNDKTIYDIYRNAGKNIPC